MTDLRNIVIATAQGSKKIHAFHLHNDNKRTVCSQTLGDIGPFRFDAFMSHADACKTCKRQVERWK